MFVANLIKVWLVEIDHECTLLHVVYAIFFHN